MLRLFLTGVGRLLFWPVVKLTIIGRENLPDPAAGPLLIIFNHFSWYDAPLLASHFPLAVRFMAARELQRHLFFRLCLRAFEAIPIWRGQVDRTALQTALAALQVCQPVAVFPEGGVDPAMIAQIAQGIQILDSRGHISRSPAELIPARPGVAFLAVHSQARILPVAMWGTQHLEANLRYPWRRTPVTLHIGRPFGPLTVTEEKRGPARRAQLDALGHEMMRQLAALLPAEYQGVYAPERDLTAQHQTAEPSL